MKLYRQEFVVVVVVVKEKTCILIDMAHTCRQKCHAKGTRKEAKIHEFIYRDTMNVEPEM